MLVISIFSFSHNVFYSFQHKCQFLSHYYFVVCKCLDFGQVQNFVVGKELTEPQWLKRQHRRLENGSLVRSPARPIFFPRTDDSHCDRIHPLSPLSIVSMMVMWESSQWLGKKIVQSTG